MRKLLGALSITLALAACSGAKGSDDASGGVEAEAQQNDNAGTASKSDARRGDRPAPDFDSAARILARKWGLDGYTRCGYSTIVYMAGAARNKNQEQIASATELMNFISKVKPYVNPIPGDQIVEAALRSYTLEHQNDPAQATMLAIRECMSDVGEALSASTQEGRAPTELDTHRAEQLDSSVSQAGESDRLTAPEKGEPEHVSFADLMPGRWAAEGEACGASTNFVFADDTYTHGSTSGRYTFSDHRLSMTSTQGGSEGVVTVIEPSRINIDWKAWKPVRYSKCEAS